ncbi:MAG TPA: Gldg family protein [Isosphaeraceae bacterium]|jgi:hypothetical protein|nr:Gldg family protein [Isosphaeraceae bacterium]
MTASTFTIVLIIGLSLAAFLVLFWALRGAPMGQAAEEDDADEAPRAGYRDRVVAAAIVGLVVVAIGAYVAIEVSIPWSVPLFAVGFGMVITLVSVNRRFRHASPTLRRVVQFANAALTATLLGGILIVGNVMAFKYGGHAIDFTSDRAFSLSSQTVNQLKHLDKPVKFTVFMAGQSASQRVLQALALYKAENPALVTVDAFDPFRELEKFHDLAKRVPAVEVAREQGGGVVVEYGEGEGADQIVVLGTELFDIPLPGQEQPSPDKFVTVFRGEDAITSALVRLREEKKPIILFTTGHGEPPTDQMERSRPGLGLFKARLQATGSVAADVNLAEQAIAPDVALVIIVAPRSPFQTEEINHLKSYFTEGGHVLALLGNTSPSGLDDWLKAVNVAIGTGRVYEPNQRGLPFGTVAILVGGIQQPIVDSLYRQQVVLPNAAPLTIIGTNPGATREQVNQTFADQPILRTSRRSWAESDASNPRPERDPEKEAAGPLTVGVAVTEIARATGGGQPELRPRLVVFGSPDMADNIIISQMPNNLDLLMNAVFWLRGKPELMGITPKTHVAPVFLADDALRMKLILVPTVMAFVLIIGPGLTIYLARRE